MRRAVVPALACALLVSASAAQAAPWVITLEGGAEGDSNVQRVETGPALATMRLASAVARLGGRLDGKGRVAGGTFVLGASVLARMVQASEASAENVALFGGDLRWLHAVDGRPIAVGFGVTAVDAEPITDQVGARTFTNLGADALVVLSSGDDRHLTLGAGGRTFAYKEDHQFDWSGPSAMARLDLPLWEQSGGTRSLELAAAAGFEARDYNSTALTNACPRGAPPNTDCSAGTSIPRRDRFQRVGVDLTWVGSFVITAGYQLTVIDSNSYGQSLVRHKATLASTFSLPLGLYATGLAQLQIDRYPDGLVVKTDLQRSEFTSLDDENRSSLQLRIGRPVSATWSVEARGAIWRDLDNRMDTAFRRALLYAGVVYAR